MNSYRTTGLEIVLDKPDFVDGEKITGKIIANFHQSHGQMFMKVKLRKTEFYATFNEKNGKVEKQATDVNNVAKIEINQMHETFPQGEYTFPFTIPMPYG
jgi:hypothetical protein